MKKSIYFLALTILSALLFSCRNEKENDTQKHSIVGTWKPVKKVITYVDLNNTAASELHLYNDCDKKTRYTFNADNTGRLLMFSKKNDVCVEDFDTPLNYNFHSDGKFNMETIYTEYQEGDIHFQNANTMNLKIVSQDENTKVVTTTVYTLHRTE